MSPKSKIRRTKPKKSLQATLGLALVSMGIVHGDIGASPLFALNEIFFGPHGLRLDAPSILGVISLVIWAITLIVSVKYLLFVLRADQDGEGGVFAFYSQIHQLKRPSSRAMKIILMFAAGLLLGEGMITPAISVLAAVEGLNLVTPMFQSKIVPMTIVILSVLFMFQRKGSSKVGKMFGPISMIWFIAIGVLGLRQVIETPEIFKSFNPWYAYSFLCNYGVSSTFLILGSIMLVITGAEAIFADIGHFGKLPIRISWFSLVYPALLLSYMGQGAYLLAGKTVAMNNVFFSTVPEALLVPMVVLATLAAVIASQALISGTFSLIHQSIALGLLPRLRVFHTHHEHSGQIYIPVINAVLFFGTVLLVLVYQSSAGLAYFYGLSISGVMVTTSLSMLILTHYKWGWPLWKSVMVFGSFTWIELIFFASRSYNFKEGGWIPFGVGLLLFGLMSTWKWGRKITFKSYIEQRSMTLQKLIDLKKSAPVVMDRNVVFMVQKPVRELSDHIPALVQFFVNRYEVLPKNLFLIEVVHEKIPFIHDTRYESRVLFSDPQHGKIIGVTLYFGFMEEPNVEKMLESIARKHVVDLPSDPHKWLVHVSHEYWVLPPKMPYYRKFRIRLFLFLRQLTQPAYYYYGLGRELNLSMEIMPVKVRKNDFESVIYF